MKRGESSVPADRGPQRSVRSLRPAMLPTLARIESRIVNTRREKCQPATRWSSYAQSSSLQATQYYTQLCKFTVVARMLSEMSIATGVYNCCWTDEWYYSSFCFKHGRGAFTLISLFFLSSLTIWPVLLFRINNATINFGRIPNGTTQHRTLTKIYAYFA